MRAISARAAAIFILLGFVGCTRPPALRDLAEKRGLWVGAAVAEGPLASDEDYAALLMREFNAVTPENAMKFETVHPEPGRYDFSKADTIATFAKEHNMVVRGHTLVWDNQLPAWVREGSFTQEEWVALLREHILTVAGHYRGQVIAWDVVNEAFDDEGRLRDTIWLRALGPGYIAQAFQWAHEADPDAKLFYNDTGGEGMGRKSDAIYALAQRLLAEGVPIHGVGLQMHIWLDGPPSFEDLAANLQRLGDLGLEVHITEMDVRTQYSQASPAEKLKDQAEVYRRVLAACLQASNCKAFVTWGLTDRYSWIPWYTGNPDAPLLFDEKGQPKPAYRAVLDTLQVGGP